MIYDRKKAFDSISRGFAITRYDIEQHQVISEYSLNIHGENFFRDLLNSIYSRSFENTNFKTMNFSCVDLVDHSAKHLIQITTTRSKEKIGKTLKVLLKPEFKDYKVEIYYLLDKATPNTDTIEGFRKEYAVNIQDILFDYTDILKTINDLDESKMIEICNKYFIGINEKYTDHIGLDYTIKHLLKMRRHTKINYDDNFGSIEIDEKIKLNKINARISASIKAGLDYQVLITNLEKEDNTLTSLRSLVIDEIYADVLNPLVAGIEKIPAANVRDTQYLHSRALELDIDFNKVLFTVHDVLTSHIGFSDFNSMNTGWVIIAYFFEICDIGAHS